MSNFEGQCESMPSKMAEFLGGGVCVGGIGLPFMNKIWGNIVIEGLNFTDISGLFNNIHFIVDISVNFAVAMATGTENAMISQQLGLIFLEWAQTDQIQGRMSDFSA